MPDISSRTFRTIRKGFDPEEVRRYLQEVQGLVNALESGPPEGSTDTQAEQVVAAARAQAEAIIADANLLMAEAREQKALGAWLGPDAAASEAGPDPLVDAVKQAEEIVTEAQSRAENIVREAEAQAAGIDRWDGLGEHVARIVSQAEEEAKAIVAAARTNAESIVADAELQKFQLTSAASNERSEASETLERARAQAADMVRTAETESELIKAAAEPKARTHIESVLDASRAELETARRDLETVLDQLEDVHSLLGRSLAHRPALPEFYAAERFLNGAATASTEDQSTSMADAPSLVSFDGGGPAQSPAPEPGSFGLPAAGAEPAGPSSWTAGIGGTVPGPEVATATPEPDEGEPAVGEPAAEAPPAEETSPLDRPGEDEHSWTVASASEWQTAPSNGSTPTPPW